MRTQSFQAYLPGKGGTFPPANGLDIEAIGRLIKKKKVCKMSVIETK